MAKSRTLFVCNRCGAESSQWVGKCPGCGAYGTLEENIIAQPTQSKGIGGVGRTTKKSSRHKANAAQPRISLSFSEITQEQQIRFPSGYGELDRVLGGGVVPGSLVLIGGDPGIGKSTLLLQVANQLARNLSRILYVSGEESAHQVKLRAIRLGVGRQASVGINQKTRKQQKANVTESLGQENLYIMPEINLEEILQELETLKPQVAVIDSIQSLYYPALSSAPGSVSQVRECTSALMQIAKRDNITLFIVGHVTKEGAIAGPRVLEHLVDTVLYFEGDRYASHRLLRSVKNRFGATHEIGIFEMVEQGLVEVLNPSALFLSNQEDPSPGTATVVACEGTRPLAVELQALVSPTSYASPRRSTTGVEYNRLQQILAVLEKRVGIPLSKLDAYVASAGGIGSRGTCSRFGRGSSTGGEFPRSRHRSSHGSNW